MPRPGNMGIYGIEDALYIFKIHKNKGVLYPMGYEKINAGKVIFGGTIVSLVRYLS